MSNIERYTHLSARYSTFDVGWLDENTGGRPNRAFLAEISVRYGIGPGMTLLDLGCGKGRETCELARQLGCRVIGVDALKATLELARARICREGLLGQVTLAEKRCQDPLLVLQQRVLAPFLRLPLADASIDFIWCRDAFNHTSDMART